MHFSFDVYNRDRPYKYWFFLLSFSMSQNDQVVHDKQKKRMKYA